jgi:hypothetical protein
MTYPYTSREIKDRVAIGDNKYYMKELGDGRIMLTPAPDTIIEPGTDINRELLQMMEDRIVLLMNTLFLGVSANPFVVRFNSLDGLTVEGVWNESASRIEC